MSARGHKLNPICRQSPWTQYPSPRRPHHSCPRPHPVPTTSILVLTSFPQFHINIMYCVYVTKTNETPVSTVWCTPLARTINFTVRTGIIRRQRNHYTVSQNKTPTQSFCDNFGKCAPILIILSLLHSTMNCGRRCHIICRLTSNLLLHYLAKFERSTAQLYTIVIRSKAWQIVYLQWISTKMSYSRSYVCAN